MPQFVALQWVTYPSVAQETPAPKATHTTSPVVIAVVISIVIAVVVSIVIAIIIAVAVVVIVPIIVIAIALAATRIAVFGKHNPLLDGK